MNITGTFDILHQRPQSSVWIRKSWCWALYIPQSWQSQARCLGSDCQLKNLLVIGPQNIGRLPVVTALTVNVHLISSEFTHTEVVCCYLQPKPQSESVPLYTWLSCGGGRDDCCHYVSHYWNRLLAVTIREERQRATQMLPSSTGTVVTWSFCHVTVMWPQWVTTGWISIQAFTFPRGWIPVASVNHRSKAPQQMGTLMTTSLCRNDNQDQHSTHVMLQCLEKIKTVNFFHIFTPFSHLCSSCTWYDF